MLFLSKLMVEEECVKWAIAGNYFDGYHLTCLLRNLYADQEATVRTDNGTTDWFKIGKGVYQGCTLLSCLFNVHAKYIMQNAELNAAQAGI